MGMGMGMGMQVERVTRRALYKLLSPYYLILIREAKCQWGRAGQVGQVTRDGT